MSKSTMVELVIELEGKNIAGRYDSLISEAKAGEFHDFKNNKYVCGKVELASQLSKFPELEDIRKGVINGDYDELPDEEDKAQMKKDLEGNEGLLTALGLK